MFEVGEILLAIEREARYNRGLVTFPAYLLKQLHNEVFPDTESKFADNEQTVD